MVLYILWRMKQIDYTLWFNNRIFGGSPTFCFQYNNYYEKVAVCSLILNKRELLTRNQYYISITRHINNNMFNNYNEIRIKFQGSSVVCIFPIEKRKITNQN